jgi:hypothetical protein
MWTRPPPRRHGSSSRTTARSSVIVVEEEEDRQAAVKPMKSVSMSFVVTEGSALFVVVVAACQKQSEGGRGRNY